jgi:plastocyanin domain-containing protein
MKNGIAVLLAVVALLGCDQQRQAEVSETPTAAIDQVPAPTTITPTAGEVTIKVGAEFSPGSVTVPQGQPIRLAFQRTNEPTCADEVVFPTLNIRAKLPPNQTTVVELPPQQARTLSFACGMDMMKGAVVVQ